MEDIKIINRALKQYGIEPDGRPRFRVVWSTDQTEKVFGDFEIISEGGIYLGTDRSVVREIKKYTVGGVLLTDRWILEELRHEYSSVIVDSEHGHYEPLWLFRTKEGKYQKPIWKAVEYLVKRRLERVERGNKKMVETAQKEDDDKYVAQMMELLDVQSPLMASLNVGEAITVPRNYER